MPEQFASFGLEVADARLGNDGVHILRDVVAHGYSPTRVLGSKSKRIERLAAEGLGIVADLPLTQHVAIGP